MKYINNMTINIGYQGARMSAMNRASKTIMLVDDMDDLRTVLSLGLQHYGYHVITAAGGREALDLLDMEAINAVVTDLWMPGMSGQVLASAIRASERHKNLPLTLLSATCKTVDPQARKLFNYVLDKPFSLETIVDTVDQMCFAELQ